MAETRGRKKWKNERNGSQGGDAEDNRGRLGKRRPLERDRSRLGRSWSIAWPRDTELGHEVPREGSCIEMSPLKPCAQTSLGAAEPEALKEDSRQRSEATSLRSKPRPTKFQFYFVGSIYLCFPLNLMSHSTDVRQLCSLTRSGFSRVLLCVAVQQSCTQTVLARAIGLSAGKALCEASSIIRTVFSLLHTSHCA